MSSCYFAASVRRTKRLLGVPCDTSCPKKEGHWGIKFDRKPVVLGDDISDGYVSIFYYDYYLRLKCKDKGIVNYV